MSTTTEADVSEDHAMERSVNVLTVSMLCEKCSSIAFEYVGPNEDVERMHHETEPYAYSYQHHEQVLHIEMAASRGCRLCAMLNDLLGSHVKWFREPYTTRQMKHVEFRAQSSSPSGFMVLHCDSNWRFVLSVLNGIHLRESTFTVLMIVRKIRQNFGHEDRR